MSLDNFISKFKKQTVDKMLSLDDKELGSLTKTQIETLKDYTGSAYDSFNAYLRQKAAGKAYTGYLSKDSIDELEDAVEAFSKIKTKEESSKTELCQKTDAIIELPMQILHAEIVRMHTTTCIRRRTIRRRMAYNMRRRLYARCMT